LNRPFHFFFAWILVLTGVVYVAAACHAALQERPAAAKADLNWSSIAGVISAHLSWKRTSADEAWTYNVAQRLTYLGVVFVLFPGIVWTGLAMSFGVSSVFPYWRPQWRLSIRAHASLRLCDLAGDVSRRAHRHALPSRLREPCARDDNGVHTSAKERSMSRLVTRRTLVTAGLTTAAVQRDSAPQSISPAATL